MLSTGSNADSDGQPKTIGIALARARSLVDVARSSKTLPDEQRKAAQKFLREALARDFKNNQTVAARKLDVSQTAISDVLADKRGMGPKLLFALRAHTGATIEQILGAEAVPPAHVRAPDDRYPARAAAIEAARKLGVAEDVLAEVASVKLKSEVDPGLSHWAREIEFRAERRESDRAQPASEPSTEGALDRRKRRKGA
jgi:hypothetical protein